MKVMVDINVLADVFQAREPHVHDSDAFLRAVLSSNVHAFIPAHAVTTAYYLTCKFQGIAEADELVGWLLAALDIAPASKATFEKAHHLGWKDFEDAVVAVMAEAEACDYIVTRDLGDFSASTIPAIPPEEALRILHRQA